MGPRYWFDGLCARCPSSFGMENQIKAGEAGGESLHFLDHNTKKEITLNKMPSQVQNVRHMSYSSRSICCFRSQVVVVKEVGSVYRLVWVKDALPCNDTSTRDQSIAQHNNMSCFLYR